MTLSSYILLAAAITNFSGVVTFERGDIPFYFLRDDSGTNWRVKKIKGVKAGAGDVLQVSGEKEFSSKPRLITTEIKKLNAEKVEIPAPVDMSIEELFAKVTPYGNPNLYGGRFSTEGLLRDINRRQNTTQLLVGEGNMNIQVEMPWALDVSLPKDFVLGARVRVTGALAYTSIENLMEGKFDRIENLEIIPMSGADVVVVNQAPSPPFWTTRRLWTLFGAVGVLFLAMFAWVTTLRKMLRRKMNELAESIRVRETSKIEADASRRERLRLAADLHDGFQQYLAGAMFRL